MHTDFSVYNSESFDSYSVDGISEIDEKKNEKAVRILEEV